MDTKEVHTFIQQIENIIIFKSVIVTLLIIGIFYMANRYFKSRAK